MAPPRKKQCLRNRNRSKRQQMQLERQTETAEDRLQRLEQVRFSTSAARHRETNEETIQRREQNRLSMATATETETDEETIHRREQNRLSMATARETETDEETIQRREQNRLSMAVARDTETDEDALRRRTQNRLSIALSKETETQEDTLRRRQQNILSIALSRETETEEDTLRRRQQNRQSMALSRDTETNEDASQRREQNRLSMAAARERETDNDRLPRLYQARLEVSTRRLQVWRNKENAAFGYSASVDYVSDSWCNIGGMTIHCEHCNALKWKDEARGMCCAAGKVMLPSLDEPPRELRYLLAYQHQDAKDFQKHIRKYNACFAMTSFGATKEIREHGFMPTFKIQGQVYHRIGSLYPAKNEQEKFLQVYFISDYQQHAERRCTNISDVKQDIVLRLQGMLQRENNYVRNFKTAMENITPEAKLVISADRVPTGEHQRRFNEPSTSEVAILITGETHAKRDIVLNLRDSTIQKINEIHRSYDALQYPLLFWKGDDGYHFELKQINPQTGHLMTKKISAVDFYAYRIMFRPNEFNIILRGKELFHQYLVDMYAKIEAERLRYIELNQRKLRVDEYVHLGDALRNDGNVEDIGKLTILPSSFTGGPRYMHERTQDAMTYVRSYGRPDLFITFTCNPTWNEIKEELLPGQKPQDRHDLLARVFHMKQKMLMNLISKGNIFGSVQCFMYTIEWQKRGLPHAHILVWLRDKIHAQRVDEFISAEFPNPQEDPGLFNCIRTQMVHGPCGIINPNSP
ncbi:uncharacterized protein LOC129228620 [Uloborus diversus]|uniref:uncharacterized protein LOC129228620 n=1 Tax=Uloborus diversus TaxID=327109 RepID=UPI002409A35E|nr:uncharacterized protein LOC129228620 [Uloborus diversus]